MDENLTLQNTPGEKKFKLLVVDDSDINRAILIAMLEEEFQIREAKSGQEAVEILEEEIDEISLVLLDVMMPKINGFDVLQIMNDKEWIRQIPVMMVSSSDAMELVKRAYELGAADYINRTMDGILIQRRVSNIIRLFERQKESLRRVEAERASLVEEKYWLQNKDELTGCWNFNSFKRRGEELIQENPDLEYSLWYADIRQFKFINETFGYDEGDRLLKYWVNMLLEYLDEKELVGRISADQIVVLTHKRENWKFAERFLVSTDKIRNFFNEPGINYDVEVVAGVYLCDTEEARSLTINQMLDLANVAQEEAKKQSGRCYQVYSHELWEKQSRAMKIKKHLKSAIENGEISVWMQPQYNYVTGEMVGAEALCRWNHKSLGNISPGEFIPILERSSQVTMLDRYVWEEVCKSLRRWQEEKRLSIALSVNISRIDIQEEGFYDYIKDLVTKYEIDPKLLRLEITESAYMEDSEQIIRIVEQLRQDGFIVEMDDFGSGYSSLNMLKDVPIDILKLDIRFLSETEYDAARGGNILSAVIRMAHSMNLPVIAEGVETMEQADFLKNLGCKIMQGYYFARPLPFEEFEQLLDRQQTGDLAINFHGEGLRNLSEIMDARSASGFVFDRCIGPSMLVEYDGEHMAVIMVNDAVFDVLGLEREVFEQKRHDFLGSVGSPYKEDMKEAMDEAIEYGFARGRGSSFGKSGWAQATYRLVSSGAYSHILFMQIEDLTKAHSMETEIEQLNRELLDYMDLMPGGMFRFEADGDMKISHVGKGLLDLLQYDSWEAFSEKFGDSFQSLVYEPDRARVIKEIRACAHREYCYCAHRIERGDGKIGWYYACGHAVKDNEGKTWYYVMLIKLDKAKQELFGVEDKLGDVE